MREAINNIIDALTLWEAGQLSDEQVLRLIEAEIQFVQREIWKTK